MNHIRDDGCLTINPKIDCALEEIDKHVRTVSDTALVQAVVNACTYTSSCADWLSSELAEHYLRHGILGLDNYFTKRVAHQTDPCTMTRGYREYSDADTADRNIRQSPRFTFASGSRFVRLNPRFDRNTTIELLSSELQSPSCRPIQVSWLPDELAFYVIPANFSLSQSACFKSGRIYGMDVSSGAAVASLVLDRYDLGEKREERRDTSYPLRILDLCCAPGLKTCAIADIIGEVQKNTVVDIVGVDVSQQRISLCKKIIIKYHVRPQTRGDVSQLRHENQVNFRLYCTDGTTFGQDPKSICRSNLVFDSKVAWDEILVAGERKRMNKSARAREKKRLRDITQRESNQYYTDSSRNEFLSTDCDESDVHVSNSLLIEPFDRVLVDAECSTDGAVNHMLHKFIGSSKSASESSITNDKLTDYEQLSKLVALQRRLILSGFKLMKSGGILVYSTCSLEPTQNEEVVSWLLEQYPTEAFIIKLDFGINNLMIDVGSIPGTVRFRPNILIPDSPIPEKFVYSHEMMHGGGFFIAKIGKK